MPEGAPFTAPGLGDAQPTTGSYTLYGTPGLVEMPSAEMAEDAELAFTLSGFEDQARSTLTFQVHPRISGSFRYAQLEGYELDGSDRFDRSFDVRFLLLEEAEWWPSVALGFQDFIGTGVYSGEYLAATRSLGPGGDLRVTAGLGWGRFGTANVIAREDAERNTDFDETGGTANFDQFFTGPVGAFGGVAWNVTDRLSFEAEYSSDGYTEEEARDVFEVDSPWNFAVDYEITPGARLAASYLYGTTVGLQLTFTANPKRPPLGPGLETAPVPVAARPARSADPLGWSGQWVTEPERQEQVRTRLARALDAEGITLEAISLRATRAELRIRNRQWNATAQAVGRTSRILTQVLPPSVETFVIVPVRDGVPVSRITLARSDVERLESAPGRAIVERAQVTGGAGPRPADMVTIDPYPRLTWGIAPYLEFSLFDPDNPVRANVGLRFDGTVEIARGLELNAEVKQPLFGNLDEITRESDSVLPRVRSDFRLYVDDNDPLLDELTLAHYARPGDTLYSRVTAGYLERMFAGVSGELLWKPVESRLALGAELNYVQQRDPEDTFGLIDYEVFTGHLSAYYQMENGYYAQVDAGQYLAEDLGATFTLARNFDNGFGVSAYATLTDVPFEDFGEGSFDKGIRVEVPIAWLTGQPSRRTSTTVIQPISRDGGARLRVPGRLYDRVRDAHRPQIEDRAGRFWK